MRIILVLLIVLLAFASPCGAGDRQEVLSNGYEYLLHLRPVTEIVKKCGNQWGCEKWNFHPRIHEWWMVDSLKAALYVCAEMREQSSYDDVVKAIASLPNAPAPRPLCADVILHDKPNRHGAMLSIEGWHASGGIAPEPTGEIVWLYGSVVDVSLKPLLARLVVRGLETDFIVEVKPDDSGNYELRVPVGVYTMTLYPDNGRREGPVVASVGKNMVVDWVAGLFGILRGRRRKGGASHDFNS